MADVRHARLVAAARTGDLQALRQLMEHDDDEYKDHNNNDDDDIIKNMNKSDATTRMMVLVHHAAARNDMCMFVYLLEKGCQSSTCGGKIDDDVALEGMMQRRWEWARCAASLARRWRLPMATIRGVHEFVVGFNWPVVGDVISTMLRCEK